MVLPFLTGMETNILGTC